MHITLSGKHFSLGESLKEHIHAHLKKVIDKYFDHAVEAHVTLDKTTHGIESHIEVHIGRNIIVRTTEQAEDPYVSVDAAIKKVEKSLQRYKSRLKAHHGTHDESKEERSSQYILDPAYRNLNHQEETGPEYQQPPIIAETTAYIPSLTVSEAVMRMDLSDAGALLFKNKAHGGFNLVYFRKDGNIGWVDPEGNRKAHEPK